MAFRKRNAPISSAQKTTHAETNTGVQPAADDVASQRNALPQGIRPSHSDGRPTMSSGTPSLDSLLAVHAGLPLSHSLLVEETGTTDYAGALLRCYAAEGVMQGQHLHVIGAGPAWMKELPGVVEGRGGREKRGPVERKESEKMRIAWRYERMGAMGERGPKLPAGANAPTSGASIEQPFCHTFDLTTRLTIPPTASITHHAVSPNPATSPFTNILQSLTAALASAPNAIHRIAIPSLLSPLSYPPHSSQPHHLLSFLHALRALLRRFTTATALVSLPLTLHPRTSALTRWSEHLVDGVIELAPFPFRPDEYARPRPPSGEMRDGKSEGDPKGEPQGMVKLHKLPVVHERGGSVKGLGDDLAFSVSRRRFWIGAFSLPPEGGDEEAQGGGRGMPAKGEMEF